MTDSWATDDMFSQWAAEVGEKPSSILGAGLKPGFGRRRVSVLTPSKRSKVNPRPLPVKDVHN